MNSLKATSLKESEKEVRVNTLKIIVILFTQALPKFSVLADNYWYWAPECTKITLLV